MTFQNVCFFAVSDDVEKATSTLLTPDNQKFKIHFPGNSAMAKPGRKLHQLTYISTHKIINEV